MQYRLCIRIDELAISVSVGNFHAGNNYWCSICAQSLHAKMIVTFKCNLSLSTYFCCCISM